MSNLITAISARLKSLLNRIGGGDFLKFKSLVRVGFELETQETEGYVARDDDGEIDWDSASDHINDLVMDEMRDTYEVINNYLDDHFLYHLTRTQLKQVMNALDCDTIFALAEIDDTIDIDDIEQKIRESIEYDFDYSDFRIETETDIETIQNLLPNGLKAETDCSVRGFEIQTVGANTYSKFLSLANDVFKLEHTIDRECSFHIHVSVDGIRHLGGQKLITMATEYLLNNVYSMRFARRRFSNCHFYQPSIDGKRKFSLIHFHEEYKTFEFRLFGNIKTASEAKQALDLALRSLHYAYMRLTSGDTAKLVEDDTDWIKLCKESLKRLKPINDIILERSIQKLVEKYSKAS